MHSSGLTPYDPGINPISIALFPTYSRLETTEQIRGFELLRLAFFALKLRKLERRYDNGGLSKESDYEFRCNLLRHAIFQQVLALISLDARHQALRVIEVCRR